MNKNMYNNKYRQEYLYFYYYRKELRDMKNLKVVRHFIDADKLMKMGFICRGVDRNKYDRSKLIFLFDNTKELNEALNTFSKEALNKE